MGDFERTFGQGANGDEIIEGFNETSKNKQDIRTRNLKTATAACFSTFKNACEWARMNPGAVIKRLSDSEEFIAWKTIAKTQSNTQEKPDSFLLALEDVESIKNRFLMCRMLDIKEILDNPAPKKTVMHHLMDTLALGGALDFAQIDGLEKVSSPIHFPIVRLGWRFYSVTERLCLIANDDDHELESLGALFYNNETTDLFAGPDVFNSIYDAVRKII